MLQEQLMHLLSQVVKSVYTPRSKTHAISLYQLVVLPFLRLIKFLILHCLNIKGQVFIPSVILVCIYIYTYINLV
ncbi:hypothetical protein CISIN_1g035055mg [Citrus sinensis]|uniref:Uncharacterized protein n=1 Tax=Citrus sinensis TaxID=2711 RepID=A0A067G3W2_CITSI|nr:hypothetical protein CISIN_1g035055mg [Citrus sinensis]